jgi:hypothetical protein
MEPSGEENSEEDEPSGEENSEEEEEPREEPSEVKEDKSTGKLPTATRKEEPVCVSIPSAVSVSILT